MSDHQSVSIKQAIPHDEDIAEHIQLAKDINKKLVWPVTISL